MADEYIKRDTAYNYLTEYYNHRTDNQHQNLRKALNAIPSADVQPVVHGKWELAEDGWYCSSCELYPPFDCDPEEKGIPYCPWCGADMRSNAQVMPSKEGGT